MARKKLITLAKELDFEIEEQYFDYIVESFINGQFSQVDKLFVEMKRSDQIDFLEYMRVNYTYDKLYNRLLNLI